MNPSFPPSIPPVVESLTSFEFTLDDLPELQRFFDANPGYFLAVNGEPAKPNDAELEYDDLPPPEMTFDKKWILGFRNPEGELIAMAHILSDFIAESVWHIGLFIVATHLHGTGAARKIYDSLEAWMQSHGAKWIRLGAVEGYKKPEGFWRKASFTELRKRENVVMGLKSNTVRVLAKSLAGGSFEHYLNLVKRDRPD